MGFIAFGKHCRAKLMAPIWARKRLTAQIQAVNKKLGVGLKKDMLIDLLEIFI